MVQSFQVDVLLKVRLQVWNVLAERLLILQESRDTMSCVKLLIRLLDSLPVDADKSIIRATMMAFSSDFIKEC